MWNKKATKRKFTVVWYEYDHVEYDAPGGAIEDAYRVRILVPANEKKKLNDPLNIIDWGDDDLPF